MDNSKIDNLVFEGIDYSDYPEFTDAFIDSGDYDGRKMTDAELDEINEDSEFVYKKLMEYLY